MPFWSKKGKERAVEPEERSFRVLGQVLPPTNQPGSLGLSLPGEDIPAFEERWGLEFDRRHRLENNLKELYGKCSPEYNAAQEATVEVRLLPPANREVRSSNKLRLVHRHSLCKPTCLPKTGLGKR
jgi:hypothetical protein